MKTIFIIAPHFPPSSLPPAHRVRLLVNHLSDLGWNPVIFTVKHEHREEIEDKWMEDVTKKNFSTVWVNCLSPGKTRRFGIGDLGLRMIPGLIPSLIKHSKKLKPDFILYPVPPWYLMAIAPYVKRKTGVPYGIDFIDPWVRKPEPTDNIKARLSQWIARKLEGRSVNKSSVIFAVSQGIINDLDARYRIKEHISSEAIPYGVEVSDFSEPGVIEKLRKEPMTIRYIGAISDSMLDVVSVFIEALKAARMASFKVEFIGTNYAGPGLVKGRIGKIIEEKKVGDFVSENPARVNYKTALSLQKTAGILLLVGDLTPYYAASKLMGLIASQTPFIAFLHRESFPALFLAKLDYPYMVTYSTNSEDLPACHLNELAQMVKDLIKNYGQYKPIRLDDPDFVEHTAKAMTKRFIDTIKTTICE